MFILFGHGSEYKQQEEIHNMSIILQKRPGMLCNNRPVSTLLKNTIANKKSVKEFIDDFVKQDRTERFYGMMADKTPLNVIEFHSDQGLDNVDGLYFLYNEEGKMNYQRIPGYILHYVLQKKSDKKFITIKDVHNLIHQDIIKEESPEKSLLITTICRTFARNSDVDKKKDKIKSIIDNYISNVRYVKDIKTHYGKPKYKKFADGIQDYTPPQPSMDVEGDEQDQVEANVDANKHLIGKDIDAPSIYKYIYTLGDNKTEAIIKKMNTMVLELGHVVTKHNLDTIKTLKKQIEFLQNRIESLTLNKEEQFRRKRQRTGGSDGVNVKVLQIKRDNLMYKYKYLKYKGKYLKELSKI